MSILWKKGFPFGFDQSACKNCGGNCCRGKSGRIWLNQEEIRQIGSLLKINTIDFLAGYLDRFGNRYSIKERVVDKEFLCIFFNDETCSCLIYNSRPHQCRTFPFWDFYLDNPESVGSACPGIRFP